jgi:hypothetical protein
MILANCSTFTGQYLDIIVYWTFSVEYVARCWSCWWRTISGCFLDNLRLISLTEVRHEHDNSLHLARLMKDFLFELTLIFVTVKRRVDSITL